MDVEQFISEVKNSKQHTTFYHFTDVRNLPSIKNHGLLSLEQLSARAIKVTAPGGNDVSVSLDKASGMDRYVHLCFTRSHPMELRARQAKRIIEVDYVRVRTDVLKVAGSMITNDVANKTGVKPEPASTMLGKLDLEIIYTWMDWKQEPIKSRIKAANRYEILIPDHVPLEYIVT